MLSISKTLHLKKKLQDEKSFTLEKENFFRE